MLASEHRRNPALSSAGGCQSGLGKGAVLEDLP